MTKILTVQACLQLVSEERMLEGASATFLSDKFFTVSKKRQTDSSGNPVLFDDYELIKWVIFMDPKIDMINHENEEDEMVDEMG